MSTESQRKILGRDDLVKRTNDRKLVEVTLSDDTVVLLRTPTGKDYREWDQLLRNTDGSLNMERHNLREELFLIFAIVDGSGNRVLTVEDVCIDKVFDNYLLCDLDALKTKVDELTSRMSIKSHTKKFVAAS